MDWIQFICGLAAIGGMLYFFVKRFDDDLRSVNNSIQGLSDRIDSQGHRIDAQGQRMDMMCERIDRLYQMFVDLLQKSKK